MELGEVVERFEIRRQEVSLCVFYHLRAMLDGPERAIGLGKITRRFVIQSFGGIQCFDCVEGGRQSNAGVAAAVDHLLDLDEELDLPDAAAAPLKVEAGP